MRCCLKDKFPAQIRLGNGTQLSFRGLVLDGLMNGNVNVAPRLDLLARNPPGTIATASIVDCMFLIGICYPIDIQERAAYAVPPERRCWVSYGELVDVAGMAFELDANQKQPSFIDGSGSRGGVHSGGAGGGVNTAALGGGIGGALGVTPLTPPRPDVFLEARLGHEITLLPTVLGKGASGRVVEGLYMDQPVAVKVLIDTPLGDWGIKSPSPLRAQAAMAPLGAMPDPTPPGASPAGPDAPGGISTEPARGAPAGSAALGANDPSVQAAFPEAIHNFAHELAVLARCQHPNVLRLLAACVQPPRYCLVMERMETSLAKLLYGRPGVLLPMDEVISIALQVAQGLEYLHPTIVHRDLKPENVLINNPETPRMVAKLSPVYMAPVYSFGVLLWAMLSGKRPWEGFDMIAVAVRVCMLGERPPIDAIAPQRLPHKLRRLMLQCWEHDPERRPAAAELVKQLLLVREQLSPSHPAALVDS
ncbi:hypothetical protein GPECTOR_44g53 [Gonium pectorale]|uniref:Protein kinase domain-containing protein n=1 Tax=Gonium pectorale TaxID=33097 RepID=A0A150G961_GONPE|nr:hypothetical protein GPECTOR_44g53 [Gonium pectorale]|eukprot:KXZ46377.1 hypothetical protein GPECTOR_44g53 [Gonium pectorale]